MKFIQTVLTVILLGSVAIPALALDVTYEPITIPGTTETAFGMNHDGSRMIGGWGTTIYLWENGVWSPIAECSPNNKLMRMSADGGTIIGNTADSLGINYATLYHEETGWTPEVLEVPEEYLKCDLNRNNGYSVSGDGTKVTGILWDYCEAKCFLWTEETGFQDIGWTRGSRISDDGSTIVGFTALPDTSGRSPAFWNVEGAGGSGPQALHHPWDQGEVYDTTSDASVMVGTAYPYGAPPEQTGYHAFVWQPGDTTLTTLGTLSGSLTDISRATHVGDNGLIFGTSGPSSINYVAFIWTVETGMVDLKDFFADNGVVLPASTQLINIKEVSSDGRVVVGMYNDWYTGWGYYRATFTEGLSPVDETPAAGATLIRVHPNPFNPMTTVEFSLERSMQTKVTVYDLKGRQVAELADRVYGAGDHSLSWQGRDLAGRQVASGSYVIRLETEEGIDQRAVTLVK